MNKRATTLLVGTVVGLLGGCALQASPSPVAPPASPSAPPAASPSGAPPTPVPTSEPGGIGQIDPATFLQVCDRWPDDVDGNPLACDEIVRTALKGMPAGDPVTRVDTSYACATGCRPLDPDRGYAIVTAGTGALDVEVARHEDGTLGVTATTPLTLPDPPVFAAPPASAPAIDGAPASVNGREPLPHCGFEAREPYGSFDEQARRCFWDGVRAGSPVEFMSRHPDTEGLLVTTIHRYAGSGGVEVIAADEGGWYRMATGVAPAREAGRVFELAGLTDREGIPAE